MTAPTTEQPSARSKYTRELYGRIVEGYRASPGNHARAAAFAGVDRKTARRAWNTGWPSYTWAPAISGVLAEEAKEARSRAAAKVRAEDEAQASLAVRQREEAVRAQAEELGLRSAARSAAIQMAKTALERRELLGALLDRLEQQAPTMKARDLAASIREVRTILRTLPELARELTELGEHVRGEDRASVATVTVSAAYESNPDEQFADLEQGIWTFARMIELAILDDKKPVETTWRPTRATLDSIDKLRQVVTLLVEPGAPRLPPNGYEPSAPEAPPGGHRGAPPGPRQPPDAAGGLPGNHAPRALPAGLPSEADLYGDTLERERERLRDAGPPAVPSFIVDSADYQASRRILLLGDSGEVEVDAGERLRER